MLYQGSSWVLRVCVIVLFHAGLSPTHCTGVDRESCFVAQPTELAVMYNSTVSFDLQIRNSVLDERKGVTARRKLFSVDLNGESIVDEIGCPSQFKLNNLSPGMYTLQVKDADRGTVSTRTFYVAHELFWPGEVMHPLPSAASVQEEAQICDNARRKNEHQGNEHSQVHFWVIMAAWNAEKWIWSAISSLRQQTHCRFSCLIIDDASSDNTSARARRLVERDPRFTVLVNKERKGAAQNFYTVLTEYSFQIADEDVVVILDADDWLADSGVLQYLAAGPYSPAQGCWMTYGSLVYFPAGIPSPSPAFPPPVVQAQAYRRHEWISTHLRTFKFRLWRHLRADTFKTRAGDWLPMTVDMATMFPMLEMAAGRACAVERSMYVYNMANPHNDFRVNESLQLELEQEIRSRQKEGPLLWWAERKE